MVSPVRLSVCRLSITLVHPTQAVVTFGIVFLRRLVPWPSADMKILWSSSQGNPPSGVLNPRGVAKYSDVGPIEGYISETAQDTR